MTPLRIDPKLERRDLLLAEGSTWSRTLPPDNRAPRVFLGTFERHRSCLPVAASFVPTRAHELLEYLALLLKSRRSASG